MLHCDRELGSGPSEGYGCGVRGQSGWGPPSPGTGGIQVGKADATDHTEWTLTTPYDFDFIGSTPQLKKHQLKACRHSLIIASALVTVVCMGQKANDPAFPEPSPELLAAQRRVRSALSNAKVFLSRDGLNMGIKALQDVVKLQRREIENRYGGYHPEVYLDLGEALAEANRFDEALEAYRSGFQWSESIGDLRLEPGREHGIGYATLLARAGKFEEAKAMYYWVLRQWTVSGGYEEFPFLVVFDPDPSMQVWASTPDKLLSAILMLRAIHTHEMHEQNRMFDELIEREPAWVLPFIFRHHRDMDHQWIGHARAMAATPEERQWVESFDRVLTAEKGSRSCSREIGTPSRFWRP